MRRFVQIPEWTPGYMNVCPHHIEFLVECTSCGEKAGKLRFGSYVTE